MITIIPLGNARLGIYKLLLLVSDLDHDLTVD